MKGTKNSSGGIINLVNVHNASKEYVRKIIKTGLCACPSLYYLHDLGVNIYKLKKKKKFWMIQRTENPKNIDIQPFNIQELWEIFDI